MLLLTQCAACAAPLGFSSGKKCGRCQTRYCGPACQKEHWESGGHDKLCRKIRKGGGAEQYNANKKYAEAVAVAVEKCADDTKGQTCYICTQALHWKTKEGLVRMCACRGTAGFAHVSCLAEQAKILFAEVEGTNLGLKVINERWVRWNTCSLCGQDYHGVVACALGWACWKTYVGRPETDQIRILAMNLLGNGLSSANHHEDALSVQDAHLSMLRRLGASAGQRLDVQNNLAETYKMLGRLDEALRMRRDIYSGRLKLEGKEHRSTIIAANGYALSLCSLGRFEEAKSLFCKTIPVARRVLGNVRLTLAMTMNYAEALYKDPAATLDDLREAVTTFEEIEPTARRVLGSAHPYAAQIERELQQSREMLRAREGDDVSAVREGVDAMTAT